MPDAENARRNNIITLPIAGICSMLVGGNSYQGIRGLEVPVSGYVLFGILACLGAGSFLVVECPILWYRDTGSIRDL